MIERILIKLGLMDPKAKLVFGDDDRRFCQTPEWQQANKTPPYRRCRECNTIKHWSNLMIKDLGCNICHGGD